MELYQIISYSVLGISLGTGFAVGFFIGSVLTFKIMSKIYPPEKSL
jgi:hypothetical protein